MISQNIPTPVKALAIGAHPDDIEFGAGATLAKWAANGCEVSLIICTDGSKGSWDPSTSTDELAAIRKSEQRVAADELGALGEVVFLDYIDGELHAGVKERDAIASWIRKLKPEVLLSHDPWKRYRLHPDHQNAGQLAIEGIVAARDPFFLTDSSLPPHRPSQLFLFEPEECDHLETTDGYEKKKLNALESHKSQYVSTMGITEGNETKGLEDFRERIKEQLSTFGDLIGVGMAEGFKRITEL